MRVVVYGPRRKVGLLEDDRVIDLKAGAAATGLDPRVFGSLRSFINNGARGLDDARDLAHRFAASDDPSITQPVNGIKLHAPYPGARFALAGSNNPDHVANARRNRGQDITAAQVRERTRQGQPDGFWVLGDPVGPDAEVLIPQSADGLFDYEAEVAIVLAKGGKRIAAQDWTDYVWGVTLVIDWCVRSEVLANSRRPFYGHKIFDTSKSVGPWIAIDEVDPAACAVTTHVNGDLRQNFNTYDMIHSYGELLEQVSRDFTMEAGDLLSGGTGPGTAADSTRVTEGEPTPRDLFLKAGDTVTVTGSGLGHLTGHVIGDDHQA